MERALKFSDDPDRRRVIPRPITAQDYCADEATEGCAAGVMFVAPDNTVLCLRRSQSEKNYGGFWGFPGGKAEENEGPWEAASRETAEETGYAFDAARPGKLLDSVVTPRKMAFHTYVVRAPEKFEPKLTDGEHDGHVWASLDALPSPMHPGVFEMMGRRLGTTADMKPEDWSAIREGLNKWLDEEATEPAHAEVVAEDAYEWEEGQHPRDGHGQFAAGRVAALSGKPETDNPHTGGVARHEWSQGHHQVRSGQEALARGEKPTTHKQAAARLLKIAQSNERERFTRESPHQKVRQDNPFSLREAYLLRHRAEHHMAEHAAGKKYVTDVEPAKPAQDAACACHEVDPKTGECISEPVAMDRVSARTFDKDGHMRVKRTALSRAAVNEYYGREIPDAERHGLDPNTRYALLRDPEELKKAVATFNGKPLMIEHRPVNAQDYASDLVVGSVGDVEYEHPFLYGSISVWDAGAIRQIESQNLGQISAAYHYTFVPESGTFEGKSYSGRMVAISGNHCALVNASRAGPEMVVQDEHPDAEWLAIEVAVLSLSRGAAVAPSWRERFAAFE